LLHLSAYIFLTHWCGQWPPTLVWFDNGLLETRIEPIHASFLRAMLGVRRTTSALVTLAEFGRLPLTHFVLRQTLKYRNRLQEAAQDGLLGRAWQAQQLLLARGAKCWARSVEQRLAELQPRGGGAEGAVALPHLAEPSALENAYKQDARRERAAAFAAQLRRQRRALGPAPSSPIQALVDIVPTSGVDVEKVAEAWQSAYLAQFAASDRSSIVERYQYVKGDSFGYEPYLSEVSCIQLCRVLARLRCGNFPLEANTGAWVTPRVLFEHRLCRRCSSGVVDSEEHALLHCPALEHVRARFARALSLETNCTLPQLLRSAPQLALAKFAASVRVALD